MRIHKAGYSVILVAFLVFTFLLFGIYYVWGVSLLLSISAIAIALILLFILRFFRYPNRKITFGENQVICPADGKVVVIEEIDEKEFIKDKLIQVSIFMSVWNVHINWYPIVGKVLKSLHFDGRYMAAVLPKSSYENERSLVLMENNSGKKIITKQIAGAVARRIITYAKEGTVSEAGDQLGFIRFGSRVDVLLPKDATIMVQLNQKVKGGKTLLADLA